MCVELFEMQKEFPELCEKAVFPELFIDYNPGTGMGIENNWGIGVAEMLLRKVEK